MHATLRSYVTGFVLSVIFTLAAFFIVLYPGALRMDHETVIAAILGLAVIQMAVQLIFFLHLGKESGPRWRLAAFVSTLGIVIIVIAASIWILNNLNYNMMASPTLMNQYIQSQDGF